MDGTSSASNAAQAWRAQLAAWAIPEDILAAVADSPWVMPREVFARRADQSLAAPSGPSFRRASEALRPHGTVLDVGAGAGAASLPLAELCDHLVAVDADPAMLDELRQRAERLGLAHRIVEGRWPDVADGLAPADVVVCHHVAYNAPDLDAFAAALTAHARRRVVLELTAAHPLRPLNPLWMTLHGLARPAGPTAEDAADVLREIGLEPRTERFPRPPRSEYASFDALVAVTRRRLCLPPERDPDLADALRRLGVDPEHPRDLGATGDELVTLWWDVS
ncbi:MAG: class I SAM-dependent methyltransferase [Micromonosporaceae bacterium]